MQFGCYLFLRLTLGNSIPFPFWEVITKTSNSSSGASEEVGSPVLYLYGMDLQVIIGKGSVTNHWNETQQENIGLRNIIKKTNSQTLQLSTELTEQ